MVALFATFVALMSHVAGGGEVPGWLGVFVPLVLAAAVSTMVVGHRLSMWRLTLAVAVSQLLFHTLFTLGTPGEAVHLGGYAHGHHHTVTVATGVAASMPPHEHGGAAMWLAHAVAAVITIGGLYIAERSVSFAAGAVNAVRAWLRQRATVAALPATTPPDAPSQAVVSVMRVLRSLCVLRGDRHRGPPVLFGI
ncbi:hypothetical protein ACH0CG_06695 [Microbacterium sp. 179-I 1D1 NHS]|uniref:hypothetical protein n=1 Tax=Microbacterium sp. 179-I 1D1 NHS TaxID=3374298 RepID=UPI003879F7B3